MQVVSQPQNTHLERFKPTILILKKVNHILKKHLQTAKCVLVNFFQHRIKHDNCTNIVLDPVLFGLLENIYKKINKIESMYVFLYVTSDPKNTHIQRL